jgi:hypothetical protein
LFIHEGDEVDTILLRQASIKYFVLGTSFTEQPKKEFVRNLLPDV